MTRTLTHTPWGWTQGDPEAYRRSARESHDGRIHGGLKLSREAVGGDTRRSPGHDAHTVVSRRKTARNP